MLKNTSEKKLKEKIKLDSGLRTCLKFMTPAIPVQCSTELSHQLIKVVLGISID